MTAHGRRLALLLVVAVMGAAAARADQGSVFRTTATTVQVHATVIGPNGQLVLDLPRSAFQVLDNGRPQPLTLFDAGIQPISIIVMLDTSGSMLGNIAVLRRAAVQMFTRLLPSDKARIGHFGNRIAISPTFTNNVDELIRTLWLDLEPGGPTPLWGAVNASMSALARVEGRRVVLVLSDGKNTGLRMNNGQPSGPTLKEIITRAQTEDFMVYAIGMRSRSGLGGAGGLRRPGRSGGGFGRPGRSESDEPDPGLRELASESGGGYRELNDAETLGPAFAGIADELHRQYLLGYLAPEADGAVHQIEVRVKDNLRVRARRSYQAPRR